MAGIIHSPPHPPKRRPSMRIFFSLLCVVTALVLSTANAHADQAIVVDFTTGELSVVTDTGETLFSTLVVLPKRDYYPLPASGLVTDAMMGPTWSPTPNTRAQNPGRYKPFYAAYEAGNAMGHCKLTIDFDQTDPELDYVRIHGHGQPEDLGERHSRGCIRMPDAVCETMIDLVNQYEGATWVSFQY